MDEKWFKTWIDALASKRCEIDSLDAGSVTVSYGVAPLVTMDAGVVVAHT